MVSGPSLQSCRGLLDKRAAFLFMWSVWAFVQQDNLVHSLRLGLFSLCSWAMWCAGGSCYSGVCGCACPSRPRRLQLRRSQWRWRMMSTYTHTRKKGRMKSKDNISFGHSSENSALVMHTRKFYFVFANKMGWMWPKHLDLSLSFPKLLTWHMRHSCPKWHMCPNDACDYVTCMSEMTHVTYVTHISKMMHVAHVSKITHVSKMMHVTHVSCFPSSLETDSA